MLKATLRSAVLLGLLVWSVPGFAEVQNVKVGGDITARAFYRKNLDLHDENGGNTQGLDSDRFFMTTTGINIGADLTENVSTFVRLANERDWGIVAVAPNNNSDLALSQSYVTFKELFYSPLTVRIGRQPIVWGRGFVLGSNLIPSILGRGDDIHASITANEFTDFTAFDGIRATLDLSHLGGLNLPLTAEYVYIKENENSIGSNDDVNLQGVNFSAKFDKMGSEAEIYYLNKRDKSTGTSANDNFGSVSTMGVRGSLKPAEGLYAYSELAWQFGQQAADVSGVLPAGGSQQAWAFDLGADYTFAQVPTTPKIGFEWIFWSGKDVNGAVNGWDPIARGYYTTALREFQTATAGGFYGTDQAGDTAAATNQHQFAFYGSLKPVADLTISPRLTFFALDRGALPVTGSKRKGYAGAEWDTNIVYDYTSDVQFGLLYAMFAPGNVYRTPNDSVAQELVSTVSVKF